MYRKCESMFVLKAKRRAWLAQFVSCAFKSDVWQILGSTTIRKQKKIGTDFRYWQKCLKTHKIRDSKCNF